IDVLWHTCIFFKKNRLILSVFFGIKKSRSLSFWNQETNYTNRFWWHAGFPALIEPTCLDPFMHNILKSKSNRGQIEINKCSQKFTFDVFGLRYHHFVSLIDQKMTLRMEREIASLVGKIGYIDWVLHLIAKNNKYMVIISVSVDGMAKNIKHMDY
ncbi:hypothetical protein ACJX0J_013513, partial [Zea mays]